MHDQHMKYQNKIDTLTTCFPSSKDLCVEITTWQYRKDMIYKQQKKDVTQLQVNKIRKQWKYYGTGK